MPKRQQGGVGKIMNKSGHNKVTYAWEVMAKMVYKYSALILTPLSIICLVTNGWRFSLGILMGGLVGIVNLRGIIWGVNALLGVELARAKMMFLSMFRIMVIFSVLLILIILKAIDPYGLLIGFTVVFIIIVIEGLKASRQR